MMKETNGMALELFYSFFDCVTLSFMGFNLENQEDGALNFESDRREILDCTILYLKGRFDPLLSDPLLTSTRNSF